ncbi:hypothetical protein SAMN05880590_11540 [Rhizobium sp. RU35A]|uniref:hypothetical protein n=1 Tax=Rhizobium sp. RU35A TaxID=1907414 RepID=UPI0009573474|nr:hypothetical protein [Rhizobium sp. RU35A]SIR25268.1 hypothetical protein SAMN05880590_11540 [Rhizobium sp. RU35A]
MSEWREFAASSNGDRWLLGRDPATDNPLVLHRANPSSGGYETRTPIDAFLAQRIGTPERDALLGMLGKDKAAEANPSDAKTPSAKLAAEYLRLGGTRRAKIDDNIVNTRKWENEPSAANDFWMKHIEPMDDRQRRDVEIELPSISDD